MIDLTKAAEGVHKELKDAWTDPYVDDVAGLDGTHFKVTELEEAHGGFGSVEVMKALAVLKYQVNQLHNTTAQLMATDADGAAQVIQKAIATSNSAEAKMLRRQLSNRAMAR